MDLAQVLLQIMFRSLTHEVFSRISIVSRGRTPCETDTGIVDDDYFSTLGKAFVGLRMMLENYPSAKWFVVLGDDNFVLLENYLNVLSAFDPEEPWAMSRMVYREKFGCKVTTHDESMSPWRQPRIASSRYAGIALPMPLPIVHG